MAGAGVSRAGAGTWPDVDEAREANGVEWTLAAASGKWTFAAACGSLSTTLGNTKGFASSSATRFAFLYHTSTASSLNVGCATVYTV